MTDQIGIQTRQNERETAARIQGAVGQFQGRLIRHLHHIIMDEGVKF